MKVYKLCELQKVCPIAWDYLKNKNINKLDSGIYDINSYIYANIDEYYTKNHKEKKYEGHKKYVDIQIMLIGNEIISILPDNELEIDIPYSEEKDIQFYFEDKVNNVSNIKLSEGEFIIIYPGQAHKPGIELNKPEYVKKMVLKVPVNKIEVL